MTTQTHVQLAAIKAASLYGGFSTKKNKICNTYALYQALHYTFLLLYAQKSTQLFYLPVATYWKIFDKFEKASDILYFSDSAKHSSRQQNFLSPPLPPSPSIIAFPTNIPEIDCKLENFAESPNKSGDLPESTSKSENLLESTKDSENLSESTNESEILAKFAKDSEDLPESTNGPEILSESTKDSENIPEVTTESGSLPESNNESKILAKDSKDVENLPQLTNDSVNLPKSTSESENLYKSTIESENLYKSTSESVDLHESSNDSEKLSIDADSSYKKDGMDKVRAHASNISAFYWIANILIMNIEY